MSVRHVYADDLPPYVRHEENLLEPFSNFLARTHQRLVFQIIQIPDKLNLLLAYHQSMSWLNGVNIQKRHGFIVFINFMAGNFTPYNFAKNTVHYNFIIHSYKNVGTMFSMSFIRKAIGFLLLLVLKACLLLIPVVLAVVVIFGSPDKIKNTLHQSGIYDTAVNSVFDSFANRAEESSELSDSIPLDDPEIKNIVNNVITPEFIRNSVNTSVDSIYVWLDGKTTVPELSIDLTQSKQVLIEKITDYAVKRVEGLPECSVKESLALEGAEINPFSLTCRPPIDLNALQQQLIDEFNNNEELSKNLVLTADTPETRKLFEETLHPMQQVFQLSKGVPAVLALLCVLLAGVVIFISDTRKKGLRHVSFTLVIVGILVLSSTLLGMYLFNRALGVSNPPEGAIFDYVNIYDPALRDAVIKISKSILYDFNRVVVIVSGVYVIFGAGVLILLKTRFKDGETETKGTGRAPVEDGKKAATDGTEPSKGQTNKSDNSPNQQTE